MRAIFANDQVDLEGERFSIEALKRMAESPEPIPLCLNFDLQKTIGYVSELQYDDQQGEVSGKVDLVNGQRIPNSHVPVVGYYYDPNVGDDSIRVFAIGVTDKPSTPHTRFLEEG